MKDVVQLNEKLQTGKFRKNFQSIIGSGHAALVLRQDYQDQLKMVKEEINVQSIRFHGILSDDVGLVKEDSKKGYRLSPIQFDKIYDFILSLGMKPFVELGFMPEALASGQDTLFTWNANVTPPKDFKMWGDLVEDIVKHLIERYGLKEVNSWNFEVWNEPDLHFFWKGTMQQYFHLYRETVQAIKRVSSQIRVGGPATSKAQWLDEFMKFCKNNNLPLDFVSTHIYPVDQALTLLNDSEVTYKDADFLNTVFEKSRCLVDEIYGKNMPLHFTEWNSSSDCRDMRHDDSYMGPFLCRTLTQKAQLLDGFSFWTFSDIFEEQSSPDGEFHGGFGLLSTSGLKKCSYKIFQLFSQIGEDIVDIGENHLIAKNENNTFVLVWNYCHPGEEEKKIEYIFDLRKIKERGKWSKIIIGKNDNNVLIEWEKLGSQSSLKSEELNKLMMMQNMKEEVLDSQDKLTGSLSADEVHFYKKLRD